MINEFPQTVPSQGEDMNLFPLAIFFLCHEPEIAALDPVNRALSLRLGIKPGNIYKGMA